MIPGRVVRFRLMPKDCLSVLDVLDKAGISMNGKSFNTLSHLALSSMLETFRQSGMIDKEPDPFKFAERMFPYQGNADTVSKRKITNELRSASIRGFSQPVPVVATLDLDTAKTELAELDKIGLDNLDNTQQERYRQLCNVVFQ